MKRRFGTLSLAAIAFFLCTPSAGAQDLGPGFTKVKDGIYVFAPTRPPRLQLRCHQRRRGDDR